MKNILLGLFLILTAVAQGQMDFVPGQVLVQFSAESHPERIIEQYSQAMGTDAGIAIKKELSAPMNIYLVTFNPIVNPHSFLRELRADKSISNCQFNHYVYPRETVPNDPGFEEQWHHRNDENNGGTDGADIDSDLAWDITTGGLTAAGDTIVVCVIEGGNLEHPELIENAWFNHGEIPNNGIDDDNNGYVDDYQGWNVESENDEGVYIGNHGTSVMGLIGAKGNNNLGVTGVNWDIKIMSVAGESLMDEASVVEAYTYPLVQRRLYNESEGTRGAFVVATNASWGLDGGDPDEVPIWSAFYDTLGQSGILNCGATSNSNVNVDVVGDIPTACDSDYMISVTATNFNDVRTFAGYGATTIDLAAPGQAIYTTSGVAGYTTSTGTSFSSPITCGAIGLMYSIPCPDFIEAVHDNPQFGSDYARYMLLAGVDQIDNLENETVTGGRLNVNNTLHLMMDQCDQDLCLPPLSFELETVNDTVFTFSWTTFSANEMVIRLREYGNPVWTYIQTSGVNELTFDTLNRCSNYEFECANNCAGENPESLDYINNTLLNTAGCCIPTSEVFVDNSTETSADISWTPTLDVDSYSVYYRLLGESDWTLAGASETGTFELTMLAECMDYEVNIVPGCNDIVQLGTVETFKTSGCGFCIDHDFCENYAENSSSEYIDIVQVGTYENESGNNGGYAFFDGSDISLAQGASYASILTPGFPGSNGYNEVFNLWIDLNQDGEFDSSELLLSSEEGSPDPLAGDIEIPLDAVLGATRMRVSMEYIGFFNPGQPEPCEIIDEGETEEYCVTISEAIPDGVEDPYSNKSISIFPNPNQGSFTLKMEDFNVSETHNLIIFDILGQRVNEQTLSGNLTDIELGLPAGLYTYRVENTRMEIAKTGKFVVQ